MAYEEKVPHSKKRKKSQRLLTLVELERAVKPQSVSKMKFKNVEVEKIIGTENRGEDFGEDFLPLHEWMDERWLRVKEVWASGEQMDPIQLVEYGGYYFVRDGHHRVSIAKAEKMKKVYAGVIEHKVPVDLIPNMTRQYIPSFQEKVKFQKDTELFDILPEKNFDVRVPDTWDKLKTYIFRAHKHWMEDRDDKTPGKKQLILDWNIEVYEEAIAEIRLNQLTLLYPNMGVTDIFCELMEFWEDHPEWVKTANKELIEEQSKLTPIAFFFRRLKKWFSDFRATKEEEKYRFLWITRMLDKVPDAEIPDGSKRWYRFLTGHLLGYFRYHYRKKHGKNPKMDQLVKTWYGDWFVPAQKIYGKLITEIPFPDFYMEWMEYWKRKIQKGDKWGLKKSFEKFLEMKNIKKPAPNGTDLPES
ncbi:MAG: hypothetical protein A2Y33_02960 [Spirochaetes bacterium GWF1_51_8]|nr:MAG: hypothetical protein A2Y33_02960 [Spirochaetes bacterium GWF1_51_8]